MVGAEHLLRTLLAHASAWRVKLPPPCRAELAAFVEQELDRLPPVNAYRDATPPALAQEVVEVLRPSRWTVFERPLGPKELMQKLATLRRVRDWLGWASMDDLTIDDVVGEASSLASDRKHLTTTVLHFLRVIADQHWLGAPRALAELLDARLDAQAAPGRTERPTPSEELAVLVAKAKVYARMGQRPATSDMLLGIALREDAVHALFEEAGMDVQALLQFLAHGTRALPEDPATGMVDVVFCNDDLTPIEVVKDVLLAAYGLSNAEAKARIETAHETGEVVIATYEASEARTRAEQSRLQAHTARYPLRIVLRPAS